MYNVQDILMTTQSCCNKCFYRFLGACHPESGELCLGHWLELLAVHMILRGEY